MPCVHLQFDAGVGLGVDDTIHRADVANDDLTKLVEIACIDLRQEVELSEQGAQFADALHLLEGLVHLELFLSLAFNEYKAEAMVTILTSGHSLLNVSILHTSHQGDPGELSRTKPGDHPRPMTDLACREVESNARITAPIQTDAGTISNP